MGFASAVESDPQSERESQLLWCAIGTHFSNWSWFSRLCNVSCICMSSGRSGHLLRPHVTRVPLLDVVECEHFLCAEVVQVQISSVGPVGAYAVRRSYNPSDNPSLSGF